MHNRSLIFTAAALASACLTSTIIGCGSSSNGSSPGDGGSNETSTTTDGGGDDSSTMTSEGGADSGAADTGQNMGETGPSCTTKVPPTGTPIVASGTVSVQGVTNDEQVVYLDSATKKLSAVPIAGGAPANIGPWDSSQGVMYTAGDYAIFWNGATQTTAPAFGTMTVWSAAHGAKTLGSGKSYFSQVGGGFLDVSADGTQILYTDNVTAKTADIYVAAIDGSSTPTLLQSGVSYSAACVPILRFIGNYAAIGYCTSAPDAGVPSATVEAFSTAATTWATRTTFTTGGASSFFTGDSAGTQIGWLQDTANGTIATPGAYVELITGLAAPVLIDSAAGTAPLFTSDGLNGLYLTQAGLYRSPIVIPAPVQVAAGAYIEILGLSPDGSSVELAKQQDATTGFTDLYITPSEPSDAGSGVITLSSTTTAALFGPGYTADGTRALFFKSITMLGSGYVGEYDSVALPPMNVGTKIGTNVWEEWTTTGAKTIYNDNYAAGGTSGYADIEGADLAGAAAPKTLVTGADANIFLSGDKTKVVYSWSSCADGKPGIYTVAAP